jgi:predicted acyl esterase
MYGFSYQGATQLLAAAEGPPGLVAIAPWMTAHDLYHGWFYHNGALRLAATLGWGIQMLREDVRRSGLAETSRTLEDLWLNVRQQALYAPYAASPGLNQSRTPSYLKDWISHRHWDDYWRTFDLSARPPQLPALHLSGWYDLYLKGSIDTFLALQTAGCLNQYLIAGPWIHIPWGRRVGDADLGEAAALDTNLILLRWLNHWLKGSEEFASSRESADFVGKLVRVRHDGRAEFISIGIARSNWMFPRGLTPDEPFCWEFELDPTSCVFAPGECVRLEIASSAFPLYDRNSGSSVPPPEADSWTWCRATQAIHHEPAKPSRLELPIAA